MTEPLPYDSEAHLPVFAYGRLEACFEDFPLLFPEALVQSVERALSFGVVVLEHPSQVGEPFAIPDRRGIAFGWLIRWKPRAEDDSIAATLKCVDAFIEGTHPDLLGLPPFERRAVSARTILCPHDDVLAWTWVLDAPSPSGSYLVEGWWAEERPTGYGYSS